MTKRAVILGGVDYGEADRVVHALGERGREAWFAHGAKKSRRRFGGALEPFATVVATFEPKPRSGMPVLASLSVERARLSIQTGLDRIALAGYAAELVSRLAPEGADAPELLALLERQLDRLECGDCGVVERRALELSLLELLGYRPELARCAACGAELPEVARWSLSLGGALCAAHGEGARELGPKTRAWAEAVLSAGLDAIDDPCAGYPVEHARRAAEKLGPDLRAFYRGLLGGELRSEAFLEELSAAVGRRG